MNVTELARKLKIPTKDLLEMLPAMGFDIGRKAIKINDSAAQKIIREWPRLSLHYSDTHKKIEEKKEYSPVLTKIAIPEYITAKDLSQKSGIPVTRILTVLMKNGMLTSINEKIDFDTVSIISADLGIEIQKASEDDTEFFSKKDEKIISEEDMKNLLPRPPVIVIMGHVDHGKTTLLDTIRKASVAQKESGGITQHMGAYQITQKGKSITFIDTPGHEAFTTMRSRGAKIADIAILVVAADDGIKPQTKESIRIIQSAKIPMIVAINKVDKPEADIERVKKELAQENLIPEDWGGKIICQPISAKTGQGVESLLDIILLVSEMEKDAISANPHTSAIGTIIESHIDKGEGAVATVLIQNGTLCQGDLVFINDLFFGKIKRLKDFTSQTVEKVYPSTPVQIFGLKGIPSVGDILRVKSEVKRESRIKSYQLKTHGASAYTSLIKKEIKKEKAQEYFNLILRTDVLGSLEAIMSSLDKLSHLEVKVHIIARGLGHITESDIVMAESNNALIVGFHITPTSSAANLALEKNVEIKTYKIIYDLLNEVKRRVEEKLSPEVERTIYGKLKVLKIFRKEKEGMIIGGLVTEGRAMAGAYIDVYENNVKKARGIIQKLQLQKMDVKEAERGNECGIEYKGKPVIQEGDILEMYKEQIKEKKIE